MNKHLVFHTPTDRGQRRTEISSVRSRPQLTSSVTGNKLPLPVDSCSTTTCAHKWVKELDHCSWVHILIRWDRSFINTEPASLPPIIWSPTVFPELHKSFHRGSHHIQITRSTQPCKKLSPLYQGLYSQDEMGKNGRQPKVESHQGIFSPWIISSQELQSVLKIANCKLQVEWLHRRRTDGGRGENSEELGPRPQIFSAALVSLV